MDIAPVVAKPAVPAPVAAPKMSKAALQQSLVAALRSKDLDGVRRAIASGAKPTIPVELMDDFETKQYPIAWAIEAGNPEIVKLLLDNGVDANSPAKVFSLMEDEGGETVVPSIAYVFEPGASAVSPANKFELTRIFLERGANPNEKGVGKKPILASAAGLGHLDTIRLLLKSGADVNAEVGEEMDENVVDYAANDEVKAILNGEDVEEAPAPALASGMTPDEVARALLANVVPLPGFEVRSYYDGAVGTAVPVYVTTLVAGTLLFRGVNEPARMRDDYLGVVKSTAGDVEKRCLPAQYSVFFYPFPFVDYSVSKFRSRLIYVLVKDVKIAVFISPSPQTRGMRKVPGMPMKSCDKIHPFGCGLVGREYDPCFTEKFVAANPDVVGMITIADNDRGKLLKLWENDMMAKYVPTYLDSQSLLPGVPEIILFPRVTRKEINTDIPKQTHITEWLRTTADDISFIPYHISEGEEASNEALRAFLDGKIASGNITIDKTTGFYVDTTKHATPAHQLASGEFFKRISERFPELRFTRAAIPPSRDIWDLVSR